MVDIEPLAYFIVAQQPDIVNTVPLTNEEVSHSVSLMVITNSVFEDKDSAVHGVIDKSTFVCSVVGFPAVKGNNQCPYYLLPLPKYMLLQVTAI